MMYEMTIISSNNISKQIPFLIKHGTTRSLHNKTFKTNEQIIKRMLIKFLTTSLCLKINTYVLILCLLICNIIDNAYYFHVISNLFLFEN